jgi:hypothetical protein
MPSSVIDHVIFIDLHEPSILTFTNRHCQDSGDNPQDAGVSGDDDLESVITYPIGNRFNGDCITEVDHDFAVKPIGVDIDKLLKLMFRILVITPRMLMCLGMMI